MDLGKNCVVVMMLMCVEKMEFLVLGFVCVSVLGCCSFFPFFSFFPPLLFKRVKYFPLKVFIKTAILSRRKGG